MKEDLPLVSVIATCFNQAKYVTETLDSIKNQTYSNIELIIMDDCSTDHSVEVIQNWIDKTNYPCQFIAHEENQGICKTLNEALQLINGDFYQGFACDDIMLKSKIENQVALFRSLENDYAVVYSDAYLINDKSKRFYGNFIQRYKPKMLEIPSGDIYEELILSNYIPAMSVLIKTHIVKNIGGYDEDISYEDYDLWLRLAKNYRFYFSDYKSCKYRIHDKNMHTSDEVNKKNAIDSFKILYKQRQHKVAYEMLRRLSLQLYKQNSHKELMGEILELNFEDNFFESMKKGLSYNEHLKRVKKMKILTLIKREFKKKLKSSFLKAVTF